MKKFLETELLDIFMAIAYAVQHLHSQSPPIAHRDLKIENILLHEDGTYKVKPCRSDIRFKYTPFLIKNSAAHISIPP